MLKDQKRIRTFLSYKSFQWEPMYDFAPEDDAAMDFLACREGQSCFCGSSLIIGEEQPWDGEAIKVVVDDDHKSRMVKQLARKMEKIAKRLNKVAATSNLSNVVIVVNHDPAWSADDLAAVMNTVSEKEALPIHLFIWFDDYRSDQMLFSRMDPHHYRLLSHWFQVE